MIMKAIVELEKASRIAARSGQALDEAGANWIGDVCEYNRYGMGNLEQPPDIRCANSEDDVGRRRDQFRRVLPDAVGTCLCHPQEPSRVGDEARRRTQPR